MTKRYVKAFGILSTGAVIVIYSVARASYYLENSSERSDVECPEWSSFAATYRNCLIQTLDVVPFVHVWQQWDKVVKSCLAIHVLPNMTFFHNKDDVKVTILPDSARRSRNCTVVTLGIGGDITAEQKLKILAPNCKFFGADPMPEVGKIYQQIGIYSPVAVGATGGVVNASVLSRGTYVTMKLPSVAIADYLKTVVQSRLIDHLWIDNEGPEYQILPLLERNHQGDFDICQVNVELHGPLDSYDMSRRSFGSLIKSFMANSSFLPLYVFPPVNHYRAFFVNASSTECVRKYFPQLCD